ncbi:A-kinase anchor protein 7 isoforms alpha and beta [Phlyctochytrium bullatum]|nr:A-kinase anchor protein 7 isoforms alpha and beta [Phlyctochytrium bullatum]
MTVLIMRIEKGKKDAFLSIVDRIPELVSQFFDGKVVFGLQGIGTFDGGRVVWTAPERKEEKHRLQLFSESVNNLFFSSGLVDGSYKFTPHVTLLKVRGGKHKIAPQVFAPHAKADFGTFAIGKVDLCSMEEPKTADGYYFCEKSVALFYYASLIISAFNTMAATATPAAQVSSSMQEDLKQPLYQKPVLKQIPAEEEPILRELYAYRHSLHHLRKEVHGAITLADVDAKANELGLIMHRLRKIRESEKETERNRVDDTLDSIWMILFYIWSKIAAVDESLYPAYVNLVSIIRTADALRASNEWTPLDVAPLQERLMALEETLSETQKADGANGSIRFLDPNQPAEKQAGDFVPRGQAVLTTLLNRAHRIIEILNAENETITEHLHPVHHELTSILAELDALREASLPFLEAAETVESEEERRSHLPYTLESLAPILDRLHAIDAARGPTGRFNAIPSASEPAGQATCAGLLALAYERLSELLTALDTVPWSSPLKPFERTLLQLISRLDALVAEHPEPAELTRRLGEIQHDLSAIERRRSLADGTFIPLDGNGEPFDAEEAAVMQGQARMHNLLRKCHQKVAKLVAPVNQPVSDTLIGTYENLILLRARLHGLRRQAVQSNLRFKGAEKAVGLGAEVERLDREIEACGREIAKVENTRVRGLFRGQSATVVAAVVSANEDEKRQYGEESAKAAASPEAQEEDILAWLSPQSKTPAVPEGQAAVSAMLDECESLLWETKCLVESNWI